ncbi:uracil-DNA glycosylase [Gangjinia marincola]|uniref:Uracil-DNA glycosylase n=1 Tax=Gangjinia marincola TaxID=578463 RepID=A0ABP3XTS3_9FLAO
MNVQIDESWKEYLQPEFEKPYFESLVQFIKQEYQQFKCFPKGSQIFNAFNHCSFDETKVVILGQDPYHGAGQANGLCFSVNDGIAIPPSLDNIFKELTNDIKIDYPSSGNLSSWADQGVLLLNATLTVRAHQAGSHQGKGWELFTDKVIEMISIEKEHVVFMLWGGYAKKKGAVINPEKHLVLTSGHPSPLSANRGYWFGNAHFSKANEYLVAHDKKPVAW